jgi:hypothetical protein
MDVKALHRVGWVRNRRLLILISGVGHLELDRLELPDGTVVHEAEIECADVPTHERLVELIRIHFPAAKASRLSKFQRFRNATTVHCDESPAAQLDEAAW